MPVKDRLSHPFKARNGQASIPRLKIPRPPSVNGADRGVVAQLERAFGGDDLTVATSLRLLMGGNEELTRPLEENEWLAACASAKSGAFASIPMLLWRSDDDEAPQVSESDPVARLMAKPNPQTSQSEMLEAHIVHMLEGGEDFWFLTDKSGAPLNGTADKIPVPDQIVQVPGSIVSIEKKDRHGIPAVWSYPSGDSKVEFPAHSVLQHRVYDPYNRFRGIGVAEILTRSLNVYFQAQRYQEGLLHEGGDPGGFIEVDPNTQTDEIRRLQAEADAEFGNPDNAGRWKIVAGGKYTPNPLAPKDMEYGTLLEWVRQACSSLTGVPLPAIGVLDDATLANLEASLRAMWTGPLGVVAALRRLERTLNSRFFPRLPQRMALYRIGGDLSEIPELQKDNLDAIKAASDIADRGQASMNDALALTGVDADPLPEQEVEDESGNVVAGPDGTLTGQDVETQVLNGAQLSAAIDIVAQVAAGTLPRNSGIALLVELFGLTQQQADNVMGDAGTARHENPAPPPPPVAPPGSDNDDPGEDADEDEGESKSIRSADRSSLSLDTREGRIAYAEAIEERVMQPGDAKLDTVARSYLRKYEMAQRKHLANFADKGISGRTILARRFKAIGIDKDTAPFSDQALEVLLLNREEWDAKMRDAFTPALRSIYGEALEGIAEELGSVSIGISDPRVLEQLSQQAIKLAESVNGTLATQVRESLLSVLAQPSTIADLQAAVKELLPELDEQLKGVFKNRDARASTIARTESASATNGARFSQMEAEGVAQHLWITANDSRVRAHHQDLDGEVRVVGEEFGHGLTRPHDPSAPASQVINCRCLSSPVVEV